MTGPEFDEEIRATRRSERLLLAKLALALALVGLVALVRWLVG
jgi:hypothetical protein